MERRRYPKEMKDQILKEVQETGNVAQVAKRHDVHVKTLYRWIQESKHKAWENASDDAKKINQYIPSAQEFRQLESENDKLKKLLGEKDLEIAILNDFVKKTHPGYRTKLR